MTSNIAALEAFKSSVKEIESREDYSQPLAFGIGIRKTRADKTLDVYFPHINYEKSSDTAAVLQDITKYKGNQNGYALISKSQLENALSRFEAFSGNNEKYINIELLRTLVSVFSGVQEYHKIDIIVYFLFSKDDPVQDVEEGYFKLQCISQLLVKPHGINCQDIFSKMNNIAWTNKGPILPDDLAAQRIKWIFRGEELVVSHLDKFPYMVNYHVPEGVRIVSGSRVRLGAHLSPGTTVMPAGFVNFNAGTLGNAMVEGRISAGVVVGKDSDIGGGASIMGTLSGGNKNIISIGEQCLLGANAGTGISLGFGCTVAAGVYVTAASKISLYDSAKLPVDINGKVVEEGANVVKGAELDGREYLLFIQDSLTGKIIAKPNTKLIKLNKSLHV